MPHLRRREPETAEAELNRRLARVAWQNVILSERLARVENSLFFRALRWAGGVFAGLRSRDGDAEYARWAAALDRAALQLRGRGGQPRRVARGAPGQRLPSGADYYLFVEDGATVSPHGEELLLQAIDEGAHAAYGDWDHLSDSGHVFAPRFTPTYSPTLLAHTMYWGPAFAVRADAINDAGASMHEIAIGIDGPVTRVPCVLSHRTGGVRAQVDARAIPPRDWRASIVICSRDAKLLDRSLRALAGEDAEIVVVTHDIDGGDELARVTAAHGVKRVSFTAPFHFGAMNDAGVRASSGEFVVLLNDDVFPAEPRWLDSLVATAGRGIAGGLLEYPNGRIQHAGVVIGMLPGPTHIGRLAIDGGTFWPWLRMTRDVAAVTGACMAMRRSLWDELGGFDRRFPASFNDIDLCLRARLAGHRVKLDARARLIHEESVTRNPRVRREESEQFRQLWGDAMLEPDPYFHPELTLVRSEVRLREW
ncbi:MAG: glycosyltransferase [Acidobacteria bacterium]|nr:glycosyltransferase [Acidobacteriota bacterium]